MKSPLEINFRDKTLRINIFILFLIKGHGLTFDARLTVR
jgi:hypothetical protein